MNESGRDLPTARRTGVVLRAVLVVDAAVFLVAAVLNAGVHIPLGFATPAVRAAGLAGRDR